jgi:putative DNA methylase
VLKYDIARKLAQGLGAHLDKLEHLVDIKGSEARLLPVSKRARYLFILRTGTNCAFVIP